MVHSWRFAVGAYAVLAIHLARADDAADVAALSRSFETARLSGDLNGGRDLISENATSYNLTGRARRSLLATAQSRAGGMTGTSSPARQRPRTGLPR